MTTTDSEQASVSKLSRRSIGFLNLLRRSPDNGDGWRKVSKTLWELVSAFDHPELLEVEQAAAGGGRVRLTERGQIVMGYLL